MEYYITRRAFDRGYSDYGLVIGAIVILNYETDTQKAKSSTKNVISDANKPVIGSHHVSFYLSVKWITRVFFSVVILIIKTSISIYSLKLSN